MGLKNNANIVVDFKDYIGNLLFNEMENWTIDNHEVKAGSSINPLIQVRAYKSNLSNFLKANTIAFSDEAGKSNFILLFSKLF